ncbi:hypothetical protein PG984_015632 [Apiospora sp. TS-2023a]
MKSFFVALLALPAALAAPAEPAGKHEVTACACANSKGETFVPSVCLYVRGRDYTAPDGKDYCFPAATNAEVMEDTFNAPWCAKEFPNFPERLCVKANACPLLGDTQQPC